MKRWETISLPWYETSIINCLLCGQMIPKDMWVVEDEGNRRVFCSPGCEKIYEEYWLPKYGQR